MNTDEVIEIIVHRVLQQLKSRDNQALIVFTGGGIGFHESLEQLKKLLVNEWEFNVAFSRSAENIFSKDLVKKELSVDHIYLESENDGLQSLYEDTSLLILPTLTMNTAAKIAVGIADSLTTNIVQKFIMEGLPIIASKDACNPEHTYRVKAGRKKTPESYLHMFQDYYKRLEAFGITFANANELQKAVIDHQQSLYNYQDKELKIEGKKKVITRKDMISAKETGSILEVPANSIITPLAIETADTLGVKIVRSGE